MASESPITIKVSRRVSASVGQLILLNSWRASAKKDLIFWNIDHDTNIQMVRMILIILIRILY